MLDGCLGFLGCGQMGQALLGAWLGRGAVRPEQVLVADPRTGDGLAARLGVRAVEIATIAAEAKLIVLAVKPGQVAAVADGLALSEAQLLVSIVAGLSRGGLRRTFAHRRVLRCMPSTPARVGRAVTTLLVEPDDAPADVAQIRGLFEAVGTVEPLANEAWFHPATALAGSGPAFLFVAMEALADGAVAGGLPRALASRLAAHMVRGAGALAAEEGTHPGELKDQVSSPGGTTIAGIRALESGGFRGALFEAVVAATRRSLELEGEG